MAAHLALRWSSAAATVLLFMVGWTIGTGGIVGFNTEGWTGLNFVLGKSFNHAQPWVSLKLLNARRCVRMCWLFRACTALTYTPSSQRCELHRLDRDHDDLFSTVTDMDKVIVDLRQVAMSPKKRILRGCDKRPCSENEMCAPVRNTAFYVCLQLDSETCKTSTLPSVPNTIRTMDRVGLVIYACAEGHFQSGNDVSTCDPRTKTWSAVDMTCRLVDCGSSPPVMGAVASGSRTTADATVSYSCLSGAVPSSPGMTSTCQGISGQWSPIPGPCTVVSCGPPLIVDLMTFELTKRSASEAFPGLTNETLAVAYGGEAVYTCSEGYTVPEGSSYISQCQTDGTWSSTASFQCSPIDCGPPPQVANSRPVSSVSQKHTTYGQNVTVECDVGFSPLGGFTLTCGADGQWEGPEMTCERIKCSEPPPVQDATVDFNSTEVSAMAKYECVEPGFKEGEDNSTAVCMENGEWSVVGLRCLTIPCGVPPSVNNTSYSFVHSGLILAQYVCDEGFIPAVEMMSRLCSTTWSINEVKCTGVTCGRAPPVNNSMVETTGFHYQDTATYICDPGYVLKASSAVMTCAADGEWTPQDVTCAPKKCDSPILPAFSEIVEDQQAPDPSNPSFIISGRDIFSESGLSTEDITADVSSSSIVSFEHGYEITIKCAAGYVMYTTLEPHILLQSRKFKCMKGNWTALLVQDALCVPESCIIIPWIQNAFSELKGESPVEARYQCKTGYAFASDVFSQTPKEFAELEPTTEFTVHCDTVWNVPKEIQIGCVFVSCGAIVLASESGLQAPESYSTSVRSAVELSCRPPYFQIDQSVSVQKVVTCLGEEGWSMDSVTLRCAPCNQSQDAVGIPNTVLEIKTHSDTEDVGDTAILTCAPDFLPLGGPRTVQCVSVDGTPTWQDTENVTCLQRRWVNTEPYHLGETMVPVYHQLLNTGLEACVNLTFTDELRFAVGLEKIGYRKKLDEYAARATYTYDSKKEVSTIRMTYTLHNTMVYAAQITSSIEMFPLGENAVLCMSLNLTSNLFQFSRNGEVLADMGVVWYEDIKYFNVDFQKHIFDISISYF